jgi:hypothetical protein
MNLHVVNIKTYKLLLIFTKSYKLYHLNVYIEDIILKTGVPSTGTEMFFLGTKSSPSFSNSERGWVFAFKDEKGLYSDDPKKN